MSSEQVNQAVPEDIIKIQKKLASYEKGSRNYNKYVKILRKHIKNYTMKKRLYSNIQSVERLKELSGY